MRYLLDTHTLIQREVGMVNISELFQAEWDMYIQVY